MSTFETRGKEIRNQCKALVLEFLQSAPECQPGKEGMKQSQIHKNCGFDWGNHPKASSSNQQYWIVAILSELKQEGKIEQVTESGPWRLI